MSLSSPSSDSSEQWPWPDALSALKALPDGALDEAGGAVRELINTRIAFSTIYDGLRHASLDKDLAARLDLLGKALGQDSLSHDPLACDAASPEPPLLTAIRQLEGKAPYLAAVLSPGDDLSETEIAQEAKAAGVTLSNAEGPVGMIPSAVARKAPGQPDRIEVGARASWSDLNALAETSEASFAPLHLFSAPTPLAAAQRLPGVVTETRFGVDWTASLPLPPKAVGVSLRSWAFRDVNEANEVFEEITRLHSPLWGRTMGGMDALVASNTKLWRGHSRYKEAGSGALFLALSGTPLMRRAALAEAGWFIERRGGVCHWRGPAPSDEMLTAISVGMGAARFTSLGEQPSLIPEVASHQPIRIYQHGNLMSGETIWYIRDLSRSLEQAREVLARAAGKGQTAPTPEPLSAVSNNVGAVHG